MWTPKRILMLVLGFAAFLATYGAYAFVLGGIDGLPPLPELFWPRVGQDHFDPPPVRPKRVETRLRQAFGPDCPELARPIKIELNARRTVLAADQFEIKDDGRVCLSPLSVVLFGKERNDGKIAEINTVRCQTAYLKFDRPIMNLGDIGNRKIVGGELNGNIEIVNNRRSTERDDDLFLYIPSGPVFYQEAKHLIWTDDDVRVTDTQSKPKPMEVRGRGMELELVAADPPARPQPVARKQKTENVSGVKRITLNSGVDMHLYVEGQSGFLGGPREERTPANFQGPPPPPEKAHVSIKTPGAFNYEFGKDGDVARFDVPAVAPDSPPSRSPRDVVVTRHHDKLGTVDQLLCHHLVLQLRKKDGPAAPAANPEGGMQIETAHATGKEVTLISDAEKLEAHGNDFYYNARTLLTTLKGVPGMWAVQDGNVIHAKELQIQDQRNAVPPGARGFQTATAIGPGRIDLVEKTGADKKPVHASWEKTLVSTKDGPHDLLVLTGAACFIDDEHDQTLQAETLKVWLNPAADKTAAPEPGAGAARRPHHVEATTNVVARSRELNVHDTGRLVVWFKDAPPESAPPGDKRPTPSPATTTAPPGAVPVKAAKPDAPEAPPRPIDLSARSVEAWVARADARNTLQKFWTEGNVQVRQAPAKPEDNGVDIRGDTLQMDYHPEGNYLVVTGDLAQLRMDRIFILGPEVNIDQAANKAWVTGVGAMQMESATNFQGAKLAKPVPLTVHWNRSMLFNGKYAEFHGGIQAEQENARLACNVLQTFFDRPVSLKGGENKGDRPARVQNLVCDRSVRVEEGVWEGTKLIKYQRIEANFLTMDTIEKDDPEPPKPGAPPPPANDGNEVRGSGPGTVRIVQQGAADSIAPPETKPGAAKTPTGKEDGLKLTYVSFGKSMYANSKTSKATFLENVRILNLPIAKPKAGELPNVDVDLDALLDNLPKDAMYLRCDRLEVMNRQPKVRTHQEMTARGRVMVQSRKFWGQADTVTYHEGKDQIIFHGGENGKAKLYKWTRPGTKPEEVVGQKIIYIRSTGEFTIEKADRIDGQ